MIFYFSLQVPAGLGLYWFIGNCVSIIQQSFVVGWGNLLPKRLSSPPATIGTTGSTAALAAAKNGSKPGGVPLPRPETRAKRQPKK
jgi:membrane protein insertase Oxa1/YidC/SpoIIIJ